MGVTNRLAGGHPYQVTATSVVNKFPIFMASTDMSPYSLMWQFNPIHNCTPYSSKTHLFSHLHLSFASVLYCFGLPMKILCASLTSPRNRKWDKKQSTQMTLPWVLSGCRKSILSRILFAMVSTSKSLLTARWVMRSVGEKFTFCLLKIGGSSSSFMCMNPVVLCKTEIFENTHKIYI